MYAEGRNSGESEGSLPCRVLDSNSNSFTQGIVNSHREFWKVGARIPPTRRDSQLQGQSLAISVGDIRTSEGSSGKGRDWWWAGRTQIFPV